MEKSVDLHQPMRMVSFPSDAVSYGDLHQIIYPLEAIVSRLLVPTSVTKSKPLITCIKAILKFQFLI